MFSASAIRFIQRAAERRIFDRVGFAGNLGGMGIVGGNFPAGGGVLFRIGTVDYLHLRFNDHWAHLLSPQSQYMQQEERVSGKTGRA